MVIFGPPCSWLKRICGLGFPLTEVAETELELESLIASLFFFDFLKSLRP